MKCIDYVHKKYYRFLHGHENYTLMINMDTNYTQRVRLSDQISNLHDILTIVVGSENSNFNPGLVPNYFIKLNRESFLYPSVCTIFSNFIVLYMLLESHVERIIPILYNKLLKICFII